MKDKFGVNLVSTKYNHNSNILEINLEFGQHEQDVKQVAKKNIRHNTSLKNNYNDQIIKRIMVKTQNSFALPESIRGKSFAFKNLSLAKTILFSC